MCFEMPNLNLTLISIYLSPCKKKKKLKPKILKNILFIDFDEILLFIFFKCYLNLKLSICKRTGHYNYF